MKLKLTPFLLTSIGLFMYGIYWLLFTEKSIQGYELLFGMTYIGLSIGLIVIYAIFRAIFKARVWRQTAIEIVLLCAALLYYFKTGGELAF